MIGRSQNELDPPETVNQHKKDLYPKNWLPTDSNGKYSVVLLHLGCILALWTRMNTITNVIWYKSKGCDRRLRLMFDDHDRR